MQVHEGSTLGTWHVIRNVVDNAMVNVLATLTMSAYSTLFSSQGLGIRNVVDNAMVILRTASFCELPSGRMRAFMMLSRLSRLLPFDHEHF